MSVAGTLFCAVRFAALWLVVLLSPRHRRQLVKLRHLRSQPRLAGWEVPVATGTGVCVATGQAGLVPVVGVAVFSVAFVTGQTLIGLFAVAVALGGGERRPVFRVRLIAVVVALAGVAMVAQAGGDGVTGRSAALVILAGVVGGGLTVQQAVNGILTDATRAPVVVALLNFTLGLTVSLAVVGVLVGAGGKPWPQASELWPHAGGLIGASVVGVAAASVPVVGVLIVAVALVVGQVLGALAIDAALAQIDRPAVTSLGALLVMAGVLVALRPGSGHTHDTVRSRAPN